jgi:lipopolysaccharide/colanic/teichoic acid biosynthesis glycosyltransferase
VDAEKPRIGQRPAARIDRIAEQLKRICASMALISFSPIIVIVATLIRFVMGSLVILARERIDFHCNVIAWLTFRTNAAVSNPGEAL